ncbi:DNA polymerase III subunit delta [Alkaliphilus serpentinus]|uniref:DNA polymerase III subunit delta n=1 Tax=Alkaliphilus serpentinus TaxID=1482731 RepID=A0A833HPG4_9FIRM|nr:DNA polymerase III subunit delta [Alkaliphilus serpentinus]KAB3530734.1 DNA polymerase III subunit delta [Alkaliphilus serpentinus]
MINYQDLLKQIKANSLGGLYLIYGEEPYLMEDSVKRIIKHLISPDFIELNYTNLIGKDISVSTLIDACETLPFMADKKLVMVKDFEVLQGKKKLSDEEEEELIKYLEGLPDTTCLVFYGLPSVDSRRKLVKAIGKYGEVVQINKLKDKELETWIIKYFQKRGKTLPQKDSMTLVSNLDYIGRNATQSLLDIENEMNKIIAYVGDKERIEMQDIEDISVFKHQSDIFKLLDAIGAKNLKEAMVGVTDILDGGETVFKLMATIVNQTKNILMVKLLMEEGYNSKMIATKIGIHPYVASKAATHSKGFTVSRLKELLNKALEMEYMIKSGKINDRLAFEILIMELCKG